MEGAALARKARSLLRRLDAGVLSTWSLPMTGFPFGSLAPFAMTHEGRPLLYVSRLAEHTRNLAAEPRCCLTVIEPATGDRQAVGRASLLGLAHALPAAEREAAARRYFALFPAQRAYEELGDFELWRIEPVRVRWIGGFGEIQWLEPGDWLLPAPEWASGEESICAHMNGDHADALDRIGRRLFGADGGGGEMIALDPEGFHVRVADSVRWIPFARPCTTPEQVRAEMVRLARAAPAG